MKTELLNFRINTVEKRRLMQFAEKNAINISALIRKLVTDHLEKHGA